MTGKVFLIMKKWWLIALVFTLAMSLTSCAKRRRNLLESEYGFGYCDGTIGSFDVYVIRSETQPGLFELAVIPVSLDAPGDIVSMTIANQSLAYRQVVPQIVLNVDSPIEGVFISESDLNTYDILAITPYEPGVTFLEGNSQKDAFCTLPLPGDGLEQQYYTRRAVSGLRKAK